MKKVKSARENGITLVALVVTIIVLLILSGVSVSLVLSGNGILNSASETRETHTQAGQNELNQLAVMEEYLTSGTGEGFNIKDSSGNSIAIEDIASHYGDFVENYTTGGRYQLFYVDTEGEFGEAGRIYLQATYDENRKVNLSTKYETTGLSDENSNFYKLNPDLKQFREAISNTVTQNSTSNGIKATAYMCNESNWRDYDSDGDEMTVLAFGGPSVEMFCKSYNARILNGTDTLKAKAYNQNSTYGYRYKPGNSEGDANTNSDGFGHYTTSILSQDASNMYHPGSQKWVWLASPSCYLATYVTFINSTGSSVCRKSTQSTNWLRPLVSLPSTFDIKLE